MNTQEKIQKINQLLEDKNVEVLDDYFTDVFSNADTNEFLFKVSSLRNATEKESEEILEEIINELEKI